MQGTRVRVGFRRGRVVGSFKDGQVGHMLEVRFWFGRKHVPRGRVKRCRV